MGKNLTILPRLYVITDSQFAAKSGNELLDVVTDCISAGARMFQLREKKLSTLAYWQLGRDLVGMTTASGAILVINDRADLAVVLSADGVHRPAQGLPLDELRFLLGQESIIGVSVHTLEEAIEAQESGATFVTVSPIFQSISKPQHSLAPLGLDYLMKVCERVSIPVYALGGVTPENCNGCLQAGAYGVAVSGSIMGCENPFELTSSFLNCLEASRSVS